MNQIKNMDQDFNTIENLHFQIIKYSRNSVFKIKFQKNSHNLEQYNKLAKQLNSTMGDIHFVFHRKEINNDAIDKEQNKEIIQFDEFKAGQITLSIEIYLLPETIVLGYIKEISKYMEFNSNLVSIHINFCDISWKPFDLYFIDFFNIENHFDQLRHIKFEIRQVFFRSEDIKKIIQQICNISTLLSFYLYLDCINFTDEDLKFIYSNLMKLKKLNTLYLISEGHFSNSPFTYPKYEKIRNYHKKLLRVIIKNINFYDSKNERNDYSDYSDYSDDDFE